MNWNQEGSETTSKYTGYVRKWKVPLWFNLWRSLWKISEKLIEEGTDAQIQCAHRSFGPKPTLDTPPRSIVVNFLQYRVKEAVLRNAWKKKIQLEDKTLSFDHDYTTDVIQQAKFIKRLSLFWKRTASASRRHTPKCVSIGRAANSTTTALRKPKENCIAEVFYLGATSVWIMSTAPAHQRPENWTKYRHGNARHGAERGRQPRDHGSGYRNSNGRSILELRRERRGGLKEIGTSYDPKSCVFSCIWTLTVNDVNTSIVIHFYDSNSLTWRS